MVEVVSLFKANNFNDNVIENWKSGTPMADEFLLNATNVYKAFG